MRTGRSGGYGHRGVAGVAAAGQEPGPMNANSSGIPFDFDEVTDR